MMLFKATEDEGHLIRAFVETYRGKIVHSTGALIVDYEGELYNVKGSTHDPKEVKDSKGLAWKALLNKYEVFLEASCYVTNPLPGRASNHPQFDVGGHMTPNPNGFVEVGADSYLMPLCKWHNSTSRDGTAFAHSNTKMLKLTGFMQGDSATTFQLRMSEASKLLYLHPQSNIWISTKLNDVKKTVLEIESLKSIFPKKHSITYAIFEKQDEDFYKIITNIPEGG